MTKILNGWHRKLKVKLLLSGKYSCNYQRLRSISSEPSNLIKKRKEEYQNHISVKLNNPQTSAKTYWSISEIFCKGSKVPLILPL